MSELPNMNDVNSEQDVGTLPQNEAESTSNFDGFDNIPEEARDDPDLLEAVKEAQIELNITGDKKDKEENADVDNGDTNDNLDDEDETSDVDGKEKSDPEEKDESEKEGDENPSPEDSGESQFEDDIIQGLKGKEIEKLDEESQLAIAKFVKEHEEVKNKAEDVENKFNTLLDDPVIKARVRAIDNGTADSFYQVQNLTPSEIDVIKQKIGLDDDEVKELIPLVETIARDMAKTIADNAIIAERQEIKQRETIKKGHEVLVGMAKYNPDIAIEEKDLTKFWNRGDDGKLVPNKEHPEFEKYSKGVMKIQEWCLEKGLDYNKVIKLGSKALYSASASDLGLPVVMNAKERDKKIVKSEREKIINVLRRAKTDPKHRQRSSTGGKKATILDEAGLDKAKLLQDSGYIDSMLSKAKTDDEIFEIQKMLLN